jgi:hypothetical protein
MRIDSSDRKILFAAGTLLFVTLIISAVISPFENQSSSYPSPYSPASGGAKAAYTLLSQTGYQVEHWRRPPAKLLDHGINTVLVINVPTQNPTAEDRRDIRQYVEAGGRLLAIGQTSIALLPRESVAAGVPHFAWHTYGALVPSRITSGAPDIAMAPTFYWARSDSNSQIDYGDAEYGVVVSYRYGKGEVIWWASPDPLTNSGITQHHNVQLLLNSVGAAGDRTILWDDYFHEGELTIADSLLASPLKWSLLQLGLLAGAVVFTYSRRHGPMRALQQPSRLATLEFVEILGSLYQRVGATELPVQVAYERFRHQLGGLGIGASATPQQIAARLQDRLGRLAPECERTLSECESAQYRSDIDQHESLRLVKALNEFSEQLRLRSRDEGAK